MKKFNLSTLLLSFICLLSGCNPVNYEPEPEDYIEWDGSYFYYGNYFCKSDLTNEEEYFSEVTYEGKVYPIDGVYHYQFVEDKLHMTFYIEVGLDREPEELSAYMIYSLENEETEYLYISEPEGFSYEKDLYKIVGIGESYTIFAGTGKLIKLDLNTNEGEIMYCDSYEVKNGYAVVKFNNELLVSKIDEFEFESIMPLPNNHSGFNYYIHNIDDKSFLQIIDSSSAIFNGKSIQVSSLTYYDFESGKFYEVVTFSNYKTLSLDTKKTNMFILGEETYIEYNGYTSDDKHLEYKVFRDNNILYTVTFNEDKGVELKELYSFKNNEEYSIYKFENNNIIQLTKRTLNKPINHKYYNRIDISTVYFDLEKLEFLNKKEHDYDEKIIIAGYNNIIYYFKTKNEPCFMCGPITHYYLYRFDKTSGKEGLLTYFKNHSSCPIFQTYFIDGSHFLNEALQIVVRNL